MARRRSPSRRAFCASDGNRGPKPVKSWNIYQDKLGAFTVSTAVPKGQSLVAGSFGIQTAAQAYMATPPDPAVGGRHPGRVTRSSFRTAFRATAGRHGRERVRPRTRSRPRSSSPGTARPSASTCWSFGNELWLNTTEQRGYTVALKPADVAAPTAFDEEYSGTPGVANKVASTSRRSRESTTSSTTNWQPRGARVLRGTHEVTAEAQPGFEMTGYPDGGWSLTIVAAPGLRGGHAAAPVAVPEEFVSPGVEKPGGIDITATTGRRLS